VAFIADAFGNSQGVTSSVYRSDYWVSRGAYRPSAPETIVMPSWPPGSATLRRPPSLA